MRLLRKTCAKIERLAFVYRKLVYQNMASLKREDLVDLSAEDLASKLDEAGLPKTLTRALEGKDCQF